MKSFTGSAASLKSLSNKVGEMFCVCGSATKYKKLDTKLERKLIEVKKKGSPGVPNNIKSIDSIILRFPRFKTELKKIRSVFDHYDEDSNGTIDLDELRNSLQQLQLRLTEDEIEDLFSSCDIDGIEGIQFNEFIVLLCLIYLLNDQPSQPHHAAKMGSPELKATFDTIIQVFLFLDKNGDGKLNKKDMVDALNNYPAASERSPSHITRNRFREMDWDRNGHVSFREFLFAFVHWVGIDAEEDIPIA